MHNIMSKLHAQYVQSHMQSQYWCQHVQHVQYVQYAITIFMTTCKSNLPSLYAESKFAAITCMHDLLVSMQATLILCKLQMGSQPQGRKLTRTGVQKVNINDFVPPLHVLWPMNLAWWTHPQRIASSSSSVLIASHNYTSLSWPDVGRQLAASIPVNDFVSSLHVLYPIPKLWFWLLVITIAVWCRDPRDHPYKVYGHKSDDSAFGCA